TKTCPVTTNISATNATPVIAPLTNYTIPMSTPFQLTGSATDANAGDVLTYCWEQNDDGAGQTATNSRARENKPSGPNWLSFPATTSPTRTFPRLSTVLAGGFTTGPLAGGDAGVLIEALSNVGRTLNFRLTVRDNSVYSSTPPLKVGQTAFSDMTITVTTTSGPFMVTAPNTNVSWPANSSQTITWDVANSTAAPVSCANVRILLSTDGGQTFPTVLVASTPNDGSEPVTIPTVPGLPNTTARVKIEGIGNVFFDISNTNFTISPAVSGFGLTTPAATNVACPAPATAVATLATTSNGGYTTPIVLSATAGVPAGTTVTFGTNPVTPGNSSTVTLNNANTLASGTYNVTVTGVSGAITQTVTVSFVVAAGTAPTVTAPAATAVCAGSPASFTVTTSGAAATGFQWQVSTDLGVTYTNIAGATTATYTIAATTAAQNNNRYRVIVTGQCGTATSAAAILTVNAAPVITAQPQNTTVCAGTAATFSVTATGAGLSYQWQLSTDAGVTYNNVAGATSASITVPAVTAAQQGHRYRVIVSGTCAPAVTSAAGILSVGDAAAITGQPAPVVTCAGSNATFSVTATGSSLTYQWQVSTDAGVTYTNIAGATAASYTITGVTAAQNGNLFRVTVFSCTPTGITSNSALLTVNIPVAIGTQPASAAVCEGTAVSFTAAATGTAVTYQWQVSTNNGTTWTNIAGATSATYSIASPTAALSGNQYRVVVSGTCNPAGVNSTAATLTVNTAVVITSQPANVAVCIPTTTTASFSVAATGTALTYQWQVSTNSGTSFTNIAGATTNTLNLTGVTTTMNGNQYRVVVSGTCNPAGVNSAAATLTVNSLVSITQQPRSVSICTGSNAVFSVVASGSTITYDWQVSINNSPFASVTNGAPYSGATTSTLTITNPSVSFNGYRYRVVVSGVPCGSRISDTVTLTVNVLPSVVLTASQFATITPYTPTTVNATVSPNGNYLYSWTLNGAILGNIGSSSLPVTVDETGTYQVTATNVQTGCSGRSNSVSVTARESGDVFIYPNPSSGLFQVRYFSTTAGLPQSSMLNIYDSKGARVAVNMYTATINYGRIDVDMTRMSAGVYHIELKDASGKRIVSGKAIIAK
ncbi:MAG: T9SS type A sorting domain-containing protein, partial [Sphingobacteriales bacterium]